MSNRPNTRTQPRAVRAVTAPPPSRAPWWIAAVVGIVLLGALGIALLAAGGSDTPSTASDGTIPGGAAIVPASDDAYGTVVTDGPALPQYSPDGADPAAGLPAPQLEGLDLAGDAVSAPTTGTPAVVMFVAHWCPHCQAEVPRIADWLATDGLPDGVQLVTVATANDPTADNFPAGDWLHDAGWAVPTLLDTQDQAGATAYGVSGFPFFVAVDAGGHVVARATGEIGVSGVQSLVAQAQG